MTQEPTLEELIAEEAKALEALRQAAHERNDAEFREQTAEQTYRKACGITNQHLDGMRNTIYTALRIT